MIYKYVCVHIDRPRTLTVLSTMLGGLLYVAMKPEMTDTSINIRLYVMLLMIDNY